MGIFGLQSFLQNYCKGGYEEVKLSDIARKYREEMKKDPVMLVDASSSVTSFAKTPDLRELKKFKENLELFINKCFEIGIKLIFVGEGTRPVSNYDRWKNRIGFRLSTARESIYHFYRGILLGVVEGVTQSSNKCEYMRSFYEADSKIRTYARSHGCFAILSRDSDFVIMDGAQYVLSPQSFNEDFTYAMNYNRNNLAKFLNLDVEQLPMLGALASSYGEYVDLKNKKGCKKFCDFPGFAEKVRKLTADNLEFDTLNLSKDQLSKFKQNLHFYTEEIEMEPMEGERTENETWNDIFRLAKKRHVTGFADKKILAALENRVNFIPDLSVFEDGSTKPALWLVYLRRKIYGILFSEYPEKVCVREYVMAKTGIVVHPVKCEPHPHCGLLKLWSDDRSTEMMNKRRELFFEALDENLTLSMVQELDIQEEFLFPVLALFHLLTESRGQVPCIDRRIFLLPTILVNKLSSKEIEKYRGTLQGMSSLNLCEWYMMTLHHIQFLNSVCGEPYCRFKTNVLNSFDGTLYEHFYEISLRSRQEEYDLLSSDDLRELQCLENKLTELCHRVEEKRRNNNNSKKMPS